MEMCSHVSRVIKTLWLFPYLINEGHENQKLQIGHKNKHNLIRVVCVCEDHKISEKGKF